MVTFSGRRSRWLRVCAAAALLPVIASCSGSRQETRPDAGVTFPGKTDGLIRPRLFKDTLAIVTQLNAIVEGDVSDIAYSYQDCEGPRTRVVLRNVRTLLGEPHDATLNLQMFGGPLPDGRFVEASELPAFAIGAHYVIFLRNTDWRFSPVITNLALRVERIAGRDVLVTSDGFGVTGVSDTRVETATPALTAPAGLHAAGTIAATSSGAGDSPFVACPPGPDGLADCSRVPKPTPQSPAGRVSDSVRFARPAQTDGISPPDVASTIATRELVDRIATFAKSNGVRVGGYYAASPRLECWSTTVITSKGRR